MSQARPGGPAGSVDPGGTGWVVVTDRRHHNPAGTLPGCPDHQAVFNDPAQTRAEYLAASVAAADLIYRSRLTPMGLDGIRMRRPPELVEAAFPDGGPYLDAQAHIPVPLQPTPQTQQWGQLWAGQAHQGVCTILPVPAPPGTRNLWTCVFLHLATAIEVRHAAPWPRA